MAIRRRVRAKALPGEHTVLDTSSTVAAAIIFKIQCPGPVEAIKIPIIAILGAFAVTRIRNQEPGHRAIIGV